MAASLASLKRKIRALGWHRAKPEEWAADRAWSQYDEDPENRLQCLTEDDAFARQLRAGNEWPDPYGHEQYLYKLSRPVVVEPLHGFVCHGGAVLDFLAGIHADVAPAKELPFRWKLALQKATHVERAILLRHDYGETNYFHFYNDVLSKILLLRRFPEFQNWPWLVSGAQYRTAFFQGFLKRLPSPSPTIIIQENEPVRVDQLICLKGMGLTPSWLRDVVDLLKVPPAPLNANDRVLLVRRNSRRHILENPDEVESVCAAFGFRTVDTEGMSLDEQIELFRNIRFLVAEHGAGITNILFRQGAPLRVMELYPPDYHSDCYYFMCKMLGNQHRLLPGRKTRGEHHHIDPQELETSLRSFVS